MISRLSSVVSELHHTITILTYTHGVSCVGREDHKPAYALLEDMAASPKNACARNSTRDESKRAKNSVV